MSAVPPDVNGPGAELLSPPGGAGGSGKTVGKDEKGEKDNELQTLRRALRELQAEVNDLRLVLESVRAGDTTLQDYAVYVEGTKQDIGKLLAEIDANQVDPEDADTIRHIHNMWEQMKDCPLLDPAKPPPSAQGQLHWLNILESQMERLVFEIGLMTIPSRLDGWLQNARSGYYVPFHAVFSDELPSQDDRVTILNLLACTPKLVPGVSSMLQNGLIYRYSQKAWHVALSFCGLLLGLAAAPGIIVLACWLPIWLPGGDWPFASSDLGKLLIDWAAVLLGVVVHLAVATAKRAHAQGEWPAVIAAGDVFHWIDARLGQMWFKIGLTLIGLFGLVFAGEMPTATPSAAFLVGYSLDSVVELFGASLEQRASAQLAALKKQLGATDKS